MGVGKEVFLELFGSDWQKSIFDYRRLDTIMPHPDYASYYFICVLNPVEAMPKVWELINKAHEVAAGRYRRKYVR